MQDQQLHHCGQPLFQHLLPHLHERGPILGYRAPHGLSVPTEQQLCADHLWHGVDHFFLPWNSIAGVPSVDRRYVVFGGFEILFRPRNESPDHISNLPAPCTDSSPLLWVDFG